MGGASTRSILIAACSLAVAGCHRLTINGESSVLPVDTPTEATDEQIEALNNANIKWVDAPATVAEPDAAIDAPPVKAPAPVDAPAPEPPAPPADGPTVPAPDAATADLASTNTPPAARKRATPKPKKATAG